jgi:NADH dehydrogenase [ubiquinone] 1 alpha subcomplex assembly factor 1
MESNYTTLFSNQSPNSFSSFSIVNDNVMGGMSQSILASDKVNNLVFNGSISTLNNGGFASFRSQFGSIDVTDYNSINFKVKGDGKRYLFRLKTRISDDHSYVYYFNTTNNWQIVSIPFDKLFPRYRGIKLRMPNYLGEELAEIGILIGNERDESFSLKLKEIWLT